MHFTIVGAGALGTILGAHLIAAGHAVTMVARGARAARIATAGLEVRGLSDLATPCTVAAPDTPLPEPGVLVFAVKTYHMESAIATLRASRPEAVFSLANGVMKHEQLAAAWGRERVLGCMANFSGELMASGVVEFTRNVLLSIGPAAGYGGAPAAAIAGAIDAAGITSVAVDDIETVEWSKFVGWLALFSLALVARTTTGVFLENPSFARLGVALMREAAAVAAARDIPLVDQSPVPVRSVAERPFREAVDLVRAVGRELSRNAPGHRMSALQDLEAGRALEVHETLGYAAREAAKLGVDAPTLGFCYEIAAGLNALRD